MWYKVMGRHSEMLHAVSKVIKGCASMVEVRHNSRRFVNPTRATFGVLEVLQKLGE
jgi:hypothetical protein